MDIKKTIKLICGWLVGKSVLNLILGFSLSNICMLVMFIAISVMLLAPIKYSNYITAVILGVVVLANFPTNIANAAIIYLIEAVVDIISIVALVGKKEVRDYFK